MEEVAGAGPCRKGKTCQGGKYPPTGVSCCWVMNHRRAQWLNTEDSLLLTVLWPGCGSSPLAWALMQLHSAVGGSAGLGPLWGWTRWASLCRWALDPSLD